MIQRNLNQQLRDYLIGQRERAGLSQSSVAARSELYGMGRVLDQRTVSRIEQQPIAADAVKIAAYLSAVGAQPQKYFELLNRLTYRTEGEATMETKLADIENSIVLAEGKIEAARSKLTEADHSYIHALNLHEVFDSNLQLVRSLRKKPVIGCFGHFDAGKSALINTIIGKRLLPEKYQPATCVVNLLMHIDDRPTTITGTVAVFRKGFKPYMIRDAQLVQEYMIEQGGSDLLDKLGVHNHDERISTDAYIATVFDSAEILKKIWLLDTPGDLNSADDSDTEKALGGVELTDGVVFVSNHAGFMRATDLGFAANILRHRPPTSPDRPIEHLLFIQSHCHSEIRSDDVIDVGNTAFKRIQEQFNKLVFSSWEEDGYIHEYPTPQSLTSRVQPFWRENENYSSTMEKRIGEMADYLAANQLTMAEQNIERAMRQMMSAFESAQANLESKKEASIERIKEVEKQDARFREQSSQLIDSFKSLILSCGSRKDADIKSMQVFFDCHTSEDGLEKLIRETYSDKKDAQTEIGQYLSQLLATRLESTLKASGKVVSVKVRELLNKWQALTPSLRADLPSADLGQLEVIDTSEFNSHAAFIGGMAGLGSLGAMALYVSTISSNLGAYILVGKAAGVLVSLGLVGSVTTVTSFVAAIGGPITVGIAIAALIGYVIYRLTGGSWQRRLAKKVTEAIDDHAIWHRIELPITDFWKHTEVAISKGLEELVTQTNLHIQTLRADAGREYDPAEVDKCIVALKSADECLSFTVRSDYAKN